MTLFRSCLLLTIIATASAHILAYDMAQLDGVRREYKRLLDVEDSEIKKAYLHFSGVSQSEWNQKLKDARLECMKEDDVYEQQCKRYGPLPPDLVEITQRLLRENGINPTSIRILNNGNQAPSAGVVTIAMSEEFFDTFHATQEEKEALILHEIMHIIKYDTEAAKTMLQLFARVPFYRKIDLFLILRKWYLAREKRVDLLACLKSPKHAHALKSLFKKMVKHPRYEDPWIAMTHPKFSTRIAYLKELYKRMQSNQNAAQV